MQQILSETHLLNYIHTSYIAKETHSYHTYLAKQFGYYLPCLKFDVATIQGRLLFEGGIYYTKHLWFAGTIQY